MAKSLITTSTFIQDRFGKVFKSQFGKHVRGVINSTEGSILTALN